jgi:hypothetical protein
MPATSAQYSEIALACKGGDSLNYQGRHETRRQHGESFFLY